MSSGVFHEVVLVKDVLFVGRCARSSSGGSMASSATNSSSSSSAPAAVIGGGRTYCCRRRLRPSTYCRRWTARTAFGPPIPADCSSVFVVVERMAVKKNPPTVFLLLLLSLRERPRQQATDRMHHVASFCCGAGKMHLRFRCCSTMRPKTCADIHRSGWGQKMVVVVVPPLFA
jgi:hypothetical protein